jgi:hypothetical protein
LYPYLLNYKMARSQDSSVDTVTGLWIQFLAGMWHFSFLQNAQAGSRAYPQGLHSHGVKKVGHGAVHLLPSSAIIRNEQSCISVHHYVPFWCRLGQPYFVFYLCSTCYTLCTITVMHCLMGIRSEKCVVRRFRRHETVIECIYTNLDKPYLHTKCMAHLVH